MSNFDDIFNTKPVVVEQPQTVLTEFRPNPKKGQNGVYNAVVRFLPNPTDPANKSIIMKYSVFLENPTTQTKMSVDCPSTIGAPDPIQTTFFALRGSANPVLQENSKKFSRKQQFASLVQILDCKSDPSIVGKILVWKYGIKINEKLNAEMNPPMGEGHNPFNIFTGRPFNVQVKEVAGFPNYDACQFFDLPLSQSGMRVVTPNGQTVVVTTDTVSTPEGKEIVTSYLKNNAPDMSKYEYHEWTAEQTTFVNQCIQLYSNPQATIQAMSAAMNPVAAAPVQQPMNTQAAMQPTINMGNTQPFTGPAAATAPQMPVDMSGFGISAPAPAAPSMGLGASQASPIAPGGFQAPQLSADVDALLGGTNPAPKAAPAPVLDLNDVLNGQMY